MQFSIYRDVSKCRIDYYFDRYLQPKTMGYCGNQRLYRSRIYPVYGANGLIGYYTEYNHEHPTIMIACRGATCGSINVSSGKAYINGNAMCLDNVSERVNLRFLEYALRYYDFTNVITGSAQPQITANNLTQVKLLIPSIEVQIRFETLSIQLDKSKFAVLKCADQNNAFRRLKSIKTRRDNTNE